MNGPLKDILVLDLTRVLVGPYCTMILSDLGARVIKVEAPEIGDDSRKFGPFIDDQSAYFMSLNRGKESIALNLKNLLVVDLTRVLVGPYCTMILSDLGARVIKIEAPEIGDDSRKFGPFIKDYSAYFMSLNRGKESIALNLKNDDDKKIFEKILSKADILVENFKPGTLEKWGFGWKDVSKKYPKLIYASASGFGQTGPLKELPAYDMVVQGMGCLLYTSDAADE